MAKNRNNQTAMELVYHNNVNRFNILKMFERFEQCRKDFPVESYSKVFFCGNTGAGKSSLAAIIMERAEKPPNYEFDTSDPIPVDLLTTGINVHTFSSHEVGNIVLYDLAGHEEYYSSHAAILENLMLSTPAVFAILSKMTDDLRTIKYDLYYWFNFIKNVSLQLSMSRPSQILVIGSRLDEMTGGCKEISKVVAEVAEKADHSQEYCGFLPMECHRPGGKGVKEFVGMLSYSCKAVLDRSDKISFYCHVQFSHLQYLRSKENIVAISLKKLCIVLRERDDPSLPSERAVLLQFLITLSDKGLILFLKNEDDAQSWIVIDRAALLTEVNGILFAPKVIEHAHQDFASNTGIVPTSVLKKIFPNHDIHMIIGFLTSLQFCHVLDSNSLKTFETNISALIPLPSDELLFFPSLIHAKPPTDIEIEKGLGWCLWCPDRNQFLSTRFLHLLLFSLSYIFCLPRHNRAGEFGIDREILKLARRCYVWTNGIYWENEVKVIVEVTEHYRCVTVITSMNGIENSHNVFNNVMKTVLTLKNQMHSFECEEYLISPSDLGKARSLPVRERTLYNIKDVARSVLAKCNVTDDNDTKTINIEDIVGAHDPFFCIAPSVTRALFNADLPLQHNHLQHIMERCSFLSFSLSLMSIKEHCSQLSIFAGRNPLVSISQFDHTISVMSCVIHFVLHHTLPHFVLGRNYITFYTAPYLYHILYWIILTMHFVLHHTYTTFCCRILLILH